MTDTDKNRERVKSRINASQKRKSAGAAKRRAPERPNTVGSMIEEHPALVIAGGLAVGALIAVLLPRGVVGKLAKRSTALAAVAAEAATLYSRHALDKAEAASREGRERLGELGGRMGELSETIGDGAAKAGHRAARAAGDATATARDAGRSLARKAFDLAASARR